MVWLYAAHSAALDAGVAFYGRLVTQKNDLQTLSVIEEVGQLKAPVLGLYGGADQGIPVATIDRMKEACREAAKTCAFVVYPDAPHAFHADYRPSYRAEPAQDGWKRLQEWFRQHGVA